MTSQRTLAAIHASLAEQFLRWSDDLDDLEARHKRHLRDIYAMEERLRRHA